MGPPSSQQQQQQQRRKPLPVSHDAVDGSKQNLSGYASACRSGTFQRKAFTVGPSVPSRSSTSPLRAAGRRVTPQGHNHSRPRRTCSSNESARHRAQPRAATGSDGVGEGDGEEVPRVEGDGCGEEGDAAARIEDEERAQQRVVCREISREFQKLRSRASGAARLITRLA
ncbi:unnamed protein product [Lampetra planeri]